MMHSQDLGIWLVIGSVGGAMLMPGCGDNGGASASATASSTGQATQTGTGATTEASATTSVPTEGGSQSESMSDTQTSTSTSTSTGTGTGTSDPSATLTTTPDTATSQPASASDTDSSGASTAGESSSTGGPPDEKLCSADFHAVVDAEGSVLEMCTPTQGCAAGMCIDACDAAAQSQANFGCSFFVPTPPSYPPALPPCFAVFLANTGRAHPPELPRTGRSAAIPRKRAFWRGGARPGRARSGPERTRFWQHFGNRFGNGSGELPRPVRSRPGRRRGSRLSPRRPASVRRSTGQRAESKAPSRGDRPRLQLRRSSRSQTACSSAPSSTPRLP